MGTDDFIPDESIPLYLYVGGKHKIVDSCCHTFRHI